MLRRLALPVAIVLAVAGYFVWSIVAADGGDSAPSPVDIVASGPTFATTDEMAVASDRVVHGVVVAIEPGRPISDPNDPTAGVQTQLVTVAVDEVRKGPDVDTIVVEQEASLLDGTPITINGVEPLVDGDSGWLYLIDGDGDQFPYTALTTVDGFLPD